MGTQTSERLELGKTNVIRWENSLKSSGLCIYLILIGCDRCVEAIKDSAHSHLADDLEINKAVLFLRQKDVQSATETLHSFEKRTTKMATNAAVNLSTIFYLVRLKNSHDSQDPAM